MQPDGAVHFRVWAPRHRRVDVVLEDEPGADGHALEREGDGYFSGIVPAARVGACYRYRLGGAQSFPDPASRFQPEGPHGPSRVVDPAAYRWSDAAWNGRALPGAVLYEMHVGTFTREGTWKAAAAQLPVLVELGVNVLEVMPVAEFPGRFGWGYDGVDLFAPSHLYGEPDDFRAFVDAVHGHGLAVILDVVYNHFGPDGSYHAQFSGHWFSDRYENEWGEPLNFDGSDCAPVREFFIANAGYWIDEFHLDGLRLDATQQIFDASRVHVLAQISQRVREAGGKRATLLVAENEPQDVNVVRPVEAGGHGLDALWNDDFHHAAIVAATGRNEAYYSDYLGSAQELVSTAKWSYLFQGQRYAWQGKRRGTPAFDVAPRAFVNYLQNHDQVANSASGLRLHQRTSAGRHRALTALLLLLPATPMLFQGQEFSASSPFVFFADHKAELARSVRRGRFEFLRQFRSVAAGDMQECLPDPADARTFERCKLDPGERERHVEARALHRDLLALRRDDAVFRAQRRVDGAVLAPEAFVLRFFGASGDDRLLLVNLGRDLVLKPAPEPLLAPPASRPWATLWSSEDPRYGGLGSAEIDTDDGWRIPGHAAVVLHSPR